MGITDVHVPSLIRSVLNLFHGRLTVRKIELLLKLDEQVALRTAQGELRQVLVNLISNAVDAMPKGGRLEIRCARFSTGTEGRGDLVRVLIADTGTGMPEEVQKRIFEPFYTTKGSTGTGLGLWLSLDLLHKHGSTLHVRSRPGPGTVFGIFMLAGREKTMSS